MVENYMDYSSEDCQNSFTIGQVDLMRSIIENERIGLISPNPASLGSENQVEFNVYPNPTSGSVSVVNTSGELVQIELISETGSILRKNTIQNEIVLEDLKPGVYFVRLSSESGSKTQKLVVL